MFICFDLVFTVEKNLTSSVSPQLSARCLRLFFMWSASFHRWIYTVTFPLLPCVPCPDMRMEQLCMERLWQPHFGMKSHFSIVTAELDLTFSPLAALSCQPHWGHVCWSRPSVTKPEVRMHPQGWCSAWSTACGNTAAWESSFSALPLLTPLQVNPCAESTAGLCSLWMWLCVLKAALPFLFYKGLLINVTYLGTEAAECMASYLLTGE